MEHHNNENIIILPYAFEMTHWARYGEPKVHERELSAALKPILRFTMIHKACRSLTWNVLKRMQSWTWDNRMVHTAPNTSQQWTINPANRTFLKSLWVPHNYLRVACRIGNISILLTIFRTSLSMRPWTRQEADPQTVKRLFNSKLKFVYWIEATTDSTEITYWK